MWGAITPLYLILGVIEVNNEKTKSVIAYLFGLISGLIILLMKDTEEKTRIHAAQSITIFLAYYIVKFAYGFIPFAIPYFEYILKGVYLVAIVTGMVKACSSDEPEIPVIGNIAKSIFKKQIEN